ncbi:unnamed protein product [Brugia pahangi]|uniref:Zinc finger protein n=1 Tax=Brugia pahangi TaxID=6280 RepID=A0A0N4T8C3_BRUPA|nr:unnamed protein product [Brugia pahangi]
MFDKNFPDKNDYTCHYLGCTVITKARKEYLTHRKTHGQPFIYECKVPDCGRTFDHKSSFYTHIETHEPRPQCEDCGKFLVNRNALRKHKRLCQKKSHERCYECLYPGCATVTKIRKEYLTHRKTHGQPFIYECKVPDCGRTFDHKSSFYTHIETHEPRPQCEDCGKFLVNRNALRKHKRLCQKKSHERCYECLYPGCATVTKIRKEYLTHRKTHGQPFIYECKVPDCGRTFDHRSSFYTHIETHEPRPQCEDCGKFLVNRNALRKHKRLCQKKSHERCYECLYPGCATVTKIRKEYLTHRKTHGQPFIYECRVAGCGRTFNHDSTLYYHKQTHEFHPQCERCGKLFVSRNGLNYHKKRCPTKSR